MDPMLVVLAGGLARRFGRPKQLDPVGPAGECLLDFGVFDARRAGFRRVILVVRPGLESDFRSHLDRFFPGLDMRLAVQRTEGPATPGLRRTRPWGTAHAVLAAADQIDRPFAVMNADDFYGRRSFELLANRLRRLAGTEAEGLNIGFPLGRTLSEHGGVSRAVCELNEDGTLRRIVEHMDVRRIEGTGIVGRIAGQPRLLEQGDLVSMNLWGFTPDVVEILSAGFDSFVAEWTGDESEEFLLPAVIGQAVQADRIRIDVVASPEPWFGMTFPEDRDEVARRILERIAAGEYPPDPGTKSRD
jgi:MobA-like NTP transferase domain